MYISKKTSTYNIYIIRWNKKNHSVPTWRASVSRDS